MVYRIRYTATGDLIASEHTRPEKRVPAIFYRTEAGGEPVRDWIRSLRKDDKQRIGEDVRTVEFGWPVGMPVARPMSGGLYEVRTNLTGNQISRIIFYIDVNQRMVLLHGFIKKTRRTQAGDLELAIARKAKHEKGLRSPK